MKPTKDSDLANTTYTILAVCTCIAIYIMLNVAAKASYKVKGHILMFKLITMLIYCTAIGNVYGSFLLYRFAGLNSFFLSFFCSLSTDSIVLKSRSCTI